MTYPGFYAARCANPALFVMQGDLAWAEYVAAANAEATAVVAAFDRAHPGATFPPGSPVSLASALGAAVYHASTARDQDDACKAAAEIAVLWSELRARISTPKGLPMDVQRQSTKAYERQAEAQLRALVAAHEIPVGRIWRESEAPRFGLGGRAARRVWDRVAEDHPELSSSKGKPKNRRAKA